LKRGNLCGGQPFARLIGLLGGFAGIIISSQWFNGSLLSLVISVLLGYQAGERLALFLHARRPELFSISDRTGVWAVRIVCFIAGLGGLAVGAQLLIPIHSPWEFDRLSGAGFFVVSGLFLVTLAFGKLASERPRLTTTLLGPFGVCLLVVSVLAFIHRQRFFFLGIGLLVPGGVFALLGSMRKHPQRPMDEMVWYALAGRLLPPERS
jgi:hypothetical protein